MRIIIYKRFNVIDRIVQLNADDEELELVEGVDYKIEDDYDIEPTDDDQLDFSWDDEDAGESDE